MNDVENSKQEFEPIFEAKGIVKQFPGVLALDKVNLILYPGEVHALVGENGAGKSTLIKILAGLYKKDQGEFYYKSEKIEIDDPQKSKELGMIFVHQSVPVIPNFSFAENVFLGRDLPKRLFGLVDWRKVMEETRKEIEKWDLHLNVKTSLKNLDTGQRQIMTIIRALSQNPNIIVFDEPTSSITNKEIKSLFRFIKALKKAGISILYVSHRLDEIFEVCDRYTVLRNGRYIATGLVKETNTNDLVKKISGKEILVSAREVCARYNRELLRLEGKDNSIDFNVYEGEVLGIFGLIGAGQGKLLESIFGVNSVDYQEIKKIYVKGKEKSINSPKDAINAGLAYLPSNRIEQGLIPSFSVKNNLSLPSLVKYCSRRFINFQKEKSVAEKIVEKLNISTPSLDQKVYFLSGGNQQKVVFGKWLLTDCNVLMLNEPTKGIDVGAKDEIYKIIDALARRGKGIIYVSREIIELLKLCDRILVLHKGKIVAELNRENASKEKILYYAMTGGKNNEQTAIS